MKNGENIIVFQNRTVTLNNDLLGHSGWGIKLPDGNWLFGSKEATPNLFNGHFPGTIPNGKPNGVFIKKTDFQTMIQLLKRGGQADGPIFNYHEYKLLTFPSPNESAGIAAAEKSKGEGYGVIGNNCMDSVYRIITAYVRGDGNFLPWPSTHPFPNHFFDDIKATKMKF